MNKTNLVDQRVKGNIQGTQQVMAQLDPAKASRIGSMMGNPTGATYSVPVAYDHVIMIDRPIDEPSNWREEISLLQTAGPADRVLMKINTGGGYVSTACAIVNAMKQCQAPITTELVGDCCSAGTFIFLQGDEQIVNDSMSMFMIHQASHGYGGNDNHVYDYAMYSREQNTNLVRDTYKGFLTEEEIEKAITGTEFWFTADQVSERCENRFKLLEAEDPTTPEKPTREAYAKLTKEELLDAYFGPVQVSDEDAAEALQIAQANATWKVLNNKKNSIKVIREEYSVPASFKRRFEVIAWVMTTLFGKEWKMLLKNEK